jgi:uncharacterized protein YndB with AHSA1/START domain
MADIYHDFPIFSPAKRVFDAVSTWSGLDEWWTERSSGEPRLGAEYVLGFGPDYDWRAKVIRCEPNSVFELEMTRCDPDWLGTRVSFLLSEGTRPDSTNVRFSHLGWPVANEHWRISCYCWAMYLRILRRYVEFGERVPYERRLDV